METDNTQGLVRNKLHWKIIAFVLVISFVGLALCSGLEPYRFGEENDSKMPLPYIFLFFFSGLWIFGLIVLVPVQILYFERRARKDNPKIKMTFSDLIGLPFGVSNPDATVPRWISIPVLGFFWLLMGLIVFGFAMAALSFLISKIPV